MGGMGRIFDGGYAEYTVVPVEQVQNLGVKTEDVGVGRKIEWHVLGAAPEMLQTAHGSMFTALRIEAGEKLLIRGGTTSIGLAAAALAKREGLTVLSTTRSEKRGSLLKQYGADEVIVDDGTIADSKALRTFSICFSQSLFSLRLCCISFV